GWQTLVLFGHKKTGALADAPVFSIIGRDFFPASLIFDFFLCYPVKDFIPVRTPFSPQRLNIRFNT
ncbi:MAG: hypothetical protein WBO13_05120, partial [Vibrio fluvialis]